MMPGAQIKMLRYIRSSDPKPTPGPGGSPRAQPSQPVPQHAPPPPPLSARQTLAEAAKLPVPTSGRYATSSQPPATAIPALGQQSPRHQPPAQRPRASSDNGRAPPHPDREQQIWEDSTVNSMFADSLTGSTQHRPSTARHDNAGIQRPVHFDRNRQERGPSELHPFVIGENGLLRVLATPNGTTAASLNTTIQSRSLETPRLEDPYAHKQPLPQQQHHESPPKNAPPLKHVKYPYRDARAAKRGSFSDRLSQHVQPEELSDSPTRLRKVMSGLDGREQDNRSTLFHDLDTPHRTPAPPDDDTSSAPSQGDEATNNRTPRQVRQTRQAASAPLLAPNRGLQESSLPRTSSQRDKTTSRKRRLSLDYDDAALHSMSYSDLRDQAFDYDPARVAIQAATVPTGEGLEDKLAYFKDKDENSQHHFFTQVSVREWDACGDWFLEQFEGVVRKMRARRQAKREMVATFEAEISEREKTVRTKVELIDRTLGDLKKEGDMMMEGRDVDY